MDRALGLMLITLCGLLAACAPPPASNDQAVSSAEPCSVLMTAPFTAVTGSYSEGAADRGRCNAAVDDSALRIVAEGEGRRASVRLPLAGVVVNQPVAVDELSVELDSGSCAAWDGLIDLSQPLPAWRIWIELSCREHPELLLRIAAQQGIDRPFQQ